MVLISIIIPVYNSAKWLSDCLESIINQTLKEIEIICINDGSTDNSLKILKEYSSKDNRIKIINQPNSGVSAARNAGLEIASGEHIGFIDSDDWVDPDYFLNFLKHKDVDIISTELSKKIGLEKDRLYNKEEIQKTIFPLMLKSDVLNSSCTKIFKSEIIKQHKLRFPTGMKLGEDARFIMAYLKYAESFLLIENPGYHYRENIESATRLVKDESFFKRAFDEFEFDHNNAFDLRLADDEIEKYKSIRLYNTFQSCLSLYLRHSDTLNKKQRFKIVKKYMDKLRKTETLKRHAETLKKDRKGFSSFVFRSLELNSFFLVRLAFAYSHWRNGIRIL
ncbi:MAG: glycosyltransferase family 2 protein [Moheibacter sp.]